MVAYLNGAEPVGKYTVFVLTWYHFRHDSHTNSRAAELVISIFHSFEA